MSNYVKVQNTTERMMALHKELSHYEQRIEFLRAHDKITSAQRSEINAATVKVATIKYKLQNLHDGNPMLGLPDGAHHLPPPSTKSH